MADSFRDRSNPRSVSLSPFVSLPAFFVSLSARRAHRPLQLSILLGLLAWTAGCASIGAPRPSTSYQSDVTVTLTYEESGQRFQGRYLEFYSRGKRRRQAVMSGKEVAAIDRPDLGVTWLLDLDAGTFEEYPIEDAEALGGFAPNPFGPRVDATFSRVGVETLDGRETLKFEARGSTLSGFAWFTRDLVPIRFEGRLENGASSIALDVIYGVSLLESQESDLFVIPESYAGYDDRARKGDRRQKLTAVEQRNLRDQARAIADIPELPIPY